MAHLKLQTGREFTELIDICRELAPLNIELSHWPLNQATEKTPKIGALLASDTLTPEQKEELLTALDDRFSEQQEKYGYQSRDLVALHSKVPDLDKLLAIFDKCHRHSDDEVRYIVDGSGKFGFVMPDGSQTLLTVEAEEYIRVPANTEHWFVLDEYKRIKAVRYFTGKDGWVANYTGREVHL